MTSSFRFSKDNMCFYCDGVAFFPKIQSAVSPLHPWSDVVLLKLSASLKDDLDWSLEKKSAEQIVENGKAILWEIDFQLEKSQLTRRDTPTFIAHVRALEAFVAFSAPFCQQTFGVCLYRGKMEFSSLLDPFEWEEPFYEWLEEIKEGAYSDHELKNLSENERAGEWFHTIVGQHYFQLFSAHIFASYLHRLVSFLPEALLSFTFFDASVMASPALAAQLLSKERFTYLQLGLKGAEFAFDGLTLENGRLSLGWLGDQDREVEKSWISPTLAICFPLDTHCDRMILGKIELFMLSLHRRGIQYRIISEERLTEEWNGLDRLIIISESLSSQGKRKLQGFIAAGGEVIDSISNICS